MLITLGAPGYPGTLEEISSLILVAFTKLSAPEMLPISELVRIISF